MERLRRPLLNRQLVFFLLMRLSRAWQHTCGLHGNKSSIDPKNHFMCSEGWQPSSFSKEPALSRLHSSRASRLAWWIMSSVSSKNKARFWQVHGALPLRLPPPADLSGDKRRQPATGLNSLSMMRDPRWVETFSFSLAWSRDAPPRIQTQVYDHRCLSFSPSNSSQQWHFLGAMKLGSLYLGADASTH